MKRYTALLLLALIAGVGCDRTAPMEPVAGDAAGPNSPDFLADAMGVVKHPMEGQILFPSGGGDPESVLFTPSDICHIFDIPNIHELTGDVAGEITIVETLHDRFCDGTQLIISATLEGEVTWSGLTGMIAGRLELVCRNSGTFPPTCVTKAMTARGSGDLTGVGFHFVVEPGWYPFNYSGTVLAKP